MTKYIGNEPSEVVYTAVANVTGGRTGEAYSTEPDMHLSMRSPKSMGGEGDGTNPEQLFAMGWGACFQGALGLAAKEMRMSGLKVAKSKVRVHVSFGPEGESFALAAKIEVAVPGFPLEEVQKLADRTHELCPYSKATRDNVPVEVIAVDALV
ncbi:MAG: Ohr family peroxiredoxin [Bifidobacteriaceae bacterium]|jgi:Ohr subfamily peroxiredoxin|nr:Ohr family peroxiredoxin [Bifidobacteriaceae bacterium]MCI1979006.1 Ohr family peroxiredoxin [Bifidobacteriaceae bacterium]